MTSEVQRRIDLLGERLGRSVVLNDTQVRTTHASRHFGDEDEVRIKGVLHRDAGSRVIAVLVIDADESLTPAEVALIEDFAHEAAGLIVAERHAADERAITDEQDVASRLGGDVEARARGQAGLITRGLLPDPENVRVFAAEVLPAPSTEESRTTTAIGHAFGAVRNRVRGTPLGAVRDGRGALALLSPGALSDTRAHDIAELVLAEITDFLGTSQPVRMGVGAEVDDLTTAWQSHHQADLAVRAVPILGAGPIAHWGSLGALQLLLRIPAAEMSAAFVPAAITAVREADASGRLVETLERYLRCGGGRHRRDDAHPPEPPSTTGSTGFAKSPDSTSTTATHDSTCTSGWSPIAWSSRPVATPTPPADRRARLSRSRRETR